MVALFISWHSLWFFSLVFNWILRPSRHQKSIEAILKYLKCNAKSIHTWKWNWCRFCGCVHICTGLCYWHFNKTELHQEEESIIIISNGRITNSTVVSCLYYIRNNIITSTKWTYKNRKFLFPYFFTRNLRLQTPRWNYSSTWYDLIFIQNINMPSHHFYCYIWRNRKKKSKTKNCVNLFNFLFKRKKLYSLA